MPELPEVDTIRRQLAPLVSGRQLLDGWSHPSAKFSDAPQAVGSTIETVTRRGKYLIAPLDDGRELVVHLGMTGSLRVLPAHDVPHGEPDPYVRAWWDLDDGGRLTFRDVRRFGRIAVVDAGAYSSLPTLAALGPDPFEAAFRRTVAVGRAPLQRPSPQDAAPVATTRRRGRQHLRRRGVLARRCEPGGPWDHAGTGGGARGCHPRRAAVGPRPRWHDLRDYVDADGASGDNQHHLYCYGRAGEPCERCGTVLRRRVLDARTTTWCPACQPPRR